MPRRHMRQLELWDNLGTRDTEARRVERTSAMVHYARLSHAVLAFEDCMDVWDTSHISERWPKESAKFDDAAQHILDKMRGELAKILKGIVE